MEFDHVFHTIQSDSPYDRWIAHLLHAFTAHNHWLYWLGAKIANVLIFSECIHWQVHEYYKHCYLVYCERGVGLNFTQIKWMSNSTIAKLAKGYFSAIQWYLWFVCDNVYPIHRTNNNSVNSSQEIHGKYDCISFHVVY